MLRRVHLVVLAIILLAGWGTASAGGSDSTQSRERQVKAAFLYNFLNFIEWPKEKMPDNDDPIIVGVIGNENFIKAFNPIKHKKIKGKSLDIKVFKELDVLKKEEKKLRSLRQCHAIIICTHENNSSVDSALIIKSLDDASVLIVGEQSNFLERGGHINFVIEKQKVRFEINLQAAKDDGLKIRSKLVKLAKRVIQDNS